MKVEEQIAVDIKPDVIQAIKDDNEKGWFWRKIGHIFLDTLLPIIMKVILNKYHLEPKDGQ